MSRAGARRARSSAAPTKPTRASPKLRTAAASTPTTRKNADMPIAAWTVLDTAGVFPPCTCSIHLGCEHMFVSSVPTILHADLDAFYASVEQRDDPALRGRPVIVGPGVVLSASYEARAFGVHSAMGGGRARRLCPDGAFVSPRWSAHAEGSRAVFAVFEHTAPVVEGLSIDEAFLDVTGLERISGTGREIAVRLRRQVRERAGLRSRSASRPPSTSRRWRAAWRSPTGCSS